MARYWHRAWNPVIGCKPVSTACEHCWARGWAERFGQSFEPHGIGKRKKSRGREYVVTKRCPSKGVVFAGNMTDLWGEWVHDPEHFVPYGIDAGETADAVLWLTKRAGRLGKMFKEWGPMIDYMEKGWLGNQYFGFTAENQEWYVRRANDFVGEYGGFPGWAKLWLSCEPLLGPVDLDGLDFFLPFNWVVVGCESGPRRRPCKVEWVESVVEQCRSAGVAVFVKQLDLGGKVVTDIERFPEHLRIRQVPWRREAPPSEK